MNEDTDPPRRTASGSGKLDLIDYRLSKMEAQQDRAQETAEEMQRSMSHLEKCVELLKETTDETKERIARIERFILGFLVTITLSVLGGLLALLKLPVS